MPAKVWETCLAKLRRELENEECGPVFDTNDFEEFQAAIDDLCKTYTRKNVSKLVREKLAPHFEHVRSFEKAVLSSAQTHPAASLIWSGSQAVIESACRFSEHLDTTLDQLADLYKSLPLFEQYIELFPDNKRLEYPLRDLYNDYGHFCILTIRYVKKVPSSHMLKNIITSKSRQQLRAVLNSIQIHKDDFEKEIELAFRQYSMRSSSLVGRHPDSNAVMSVGSRHFVSQRRNPAFLGRDFVLGELFTEFNVEKPSPQAEPISCLVRGMGGIGKTQTALEYTYRYRDQYDHIFWLPSERTSELVQAYSMIATKVALSESTSTVESLDHVQVLRTWLETIDKKWLLVFDNVEHWNSISAFWPSTCRNRSAIIVTSQKLELSTWTTMEIALKSLKVDAGSQLLLRLLQRDHTASDEEKDAAVQIADMFGCLPLAIAHIGGYISQSRCTLEEFQHLARKRYSFLWDGEAPATLYQYDKRLDIVWDFALEELPPDANVLLSTMAFMNPDFMPEEMLLPQAEAHSVEDSSHLVRKAEFIEMTRRLVKRHLVNRESDGGVWYFTMHRALQRGILYKLDKNSDHRRQIFQQALSTIRRITPAASPIQVPNPENWDRFEAALPHIVALRAAFLQSQPSIAGTLEFANLLYDAGFNAWEREMGLDGLDLLDTAEKVLYRLEDPDSRLRANIHCMHGVIADNIGITRKAEGLSHRQKALAIRKLLVSNAQGNVSRDDDILLHNAMNDVAESLLQNYDYAQAKTLIDTCKKKYEEWGTEEEFPFEYGKYYRNMGTVQALQGDYVGAIRSGTRAVELAELDSGMITPRYLFYFFDVACHTLQSGELETALNMHKEIRETREEICGSLHDATLQSCYAIGTIYHQKGDLKQAERWIRMSLDRAAQARWPAEPRSRAQFHLAQILRAQDTELAEAALLEKEALEVLEKLLVYDCPSYLQDVEDRMILFDHLQPAWRPRRA